jgi:hypothetical protein
LIVIVIEAESITVLFFVDGIRDIELNDNEVISCSVNGGISTPKRRPIIPVAKIGYDVQLGPANAATELVRLVRKLFITIEIAL